LSRDLLGPALAVLARMSLVLADLAGDIIGCALRVHSALGPGLFESTYEECLAYELSRRGLAFRRQVILPLIYDGVSLPRAYSADFVVEGKVLLELKTVEHVLPVHHAQVLTYLKLSGLRKALLINFNTTHLRDGIKSFVN
jgi:GxxExxY protein